MERRPIEGSSNETEVNEMALNGSPDKLWGN